MIGHRLAHFDITAKLGEGGMGEVYRASDSKLGREVAIKVLPPAVSGDAERLARFEREARLLASLNHSGIAAIYQVEEDHGVHFLVMELAAGEDLARRLERGPLSIDEAMAIGLQVAQALEVAHGSGVVHRDLKPANVMLAADGRIKVLDFGLAKALGGDDDAGDSSLTQSPTLTAGMTQAGVILGTAAYMSPEQAVGKTVDERTDIWAFGCLLYEMLTGSKAYGGASVTETLSSVMRDEPDWAEMPSDVPASVRRLLMRCLVKDPWKRLRDIGEARVVLEDPYAEAEQVAIEVSSAQPPPGAAASRRGLGWAATALAMAVSVAAGWWWASRSVPVTWSLDSAIVRVTSDPGLTGAPSVAPAGNLIAYASDRGEGGDLDIWVQPLPVGQPVQITTSDADDESPDFSPDGSRIVFRSERGGGGVYVVPALGGTERLIAAKGWDPHFSPDGRSIVYEMGGRGAGTELYLVDATGSAPRRLVEDFAEANSPVWSPDGRHLLFEGKREAAGTESSFDWWVLPLDGGEVRSTGASESLDREAFSTSTPALWLADPERLIVTRRAGDSVSLWEVPISSSRRRISGPLHRLTAGTRRDVSPTVFISGDETRLYFASITRRANLWRLPIVADELRVTGPPERLTDSEASDVWPSVSADGTKLAFLSNRLGNADVWVRDLETGAETALTMTTESENKPHISPDGRRVAFLDRSDDLFEVTTDGGVPTRLVEDIQWVTDWPAEDLILVRRDEAVARLDPGTGEVVPLIQEEGRNFYFGLASPDLEWLSFMEWAQADRTRLFIAPLGEALVPESEWIPLTDGESVDEESGWSPDGAVIYYVSERDGSRCLWGLRLDPETKRPVGEPTAVLHAHEMRHAIISTASNPQNIAVTPEWIYFSMEELAGNIWMATLRR